MNSRAGCRLSMNDRPFRLRVPAARLGFDLLAPRARRKQHTRGCDRAARELGTKVVAIAASPPGACRGATYNPRERATAPVARSGRHAVAGCGSAKSYDAQKTRSCLADQPGVKLSSKVDFVA
jgi:hypothetical protein